MCHFFLGILTSVLELVLLSCFNFLAKFRRFGFRFIWILFLVSRMNSLRLLKKYTLLTRARENEGVIFVSTEGKPYKIVFIMRLLKCLPSLTCLCKLCMISGCPRPFYSISILFAVHSNCVIAYIASLVYFV